MDLTSHHSLKDLGLINKCTTDMYNMCICRIMLFIRKTFIIISVYSTIVALFLFPFVKA